MKVCTIVGARPQFIKAAVVSHELRKSHKEILIHTGQHFDNNMSTVFFKELDIPNPDYNLGISGGTHAQMTGRMMMSIEEVLIGEKPDWVLIYGDTNSTLAAALSAAKLHIPICHVEAGIRVHSRTNPEEINRKCVDHLSTLLLAATQCSMEEMSNENLIESAELVGDPMYDAFVKYRNRLKRDQVKLKSLFQAEIVTVPKDYYYLTCHREENTKDDIGLTEVFKAMESLDACTIYPVHPRNHDRALRIHKRLGCKKIILVEPVGYLESLCLVDNAKKIVTDSGGVQREAFFAQKKCVTLLDMAAWPETMVDGRNELSNLEKDEILFRLNTPQLVDSTYQPFGDGHSADKIVDALERHMGELS